MIKNGFSEGVRRRLDQPNANWIDSVLHKNRRQELGTGHGEALYDAACGM